MWANAKLYTQKLKGGFCYDDTRSSFLVRALFLNELKETLRIGNEIRQVCYFF